MTRIKYNKEKNAIAVVSTDINASVRFYDASSGTLQRVVSARRPTSEFDLGTWTTDGNFFAAIADRRRLTLWSLLPQSPPRNIREEKEAKDSNQAREIEFDKTVTSLISCNVKQAVLQQDDQSRQPQEKVAYSRYFFFIKFSNENLFCISSRSQYRPELTAGQVHRCN